MLNHINLMGRLTKDTELRYTQSETPVANFTLAVERDLSDEKKTDFIDCVAWRNTAEFVCKYFTKGSMMAVGGRLQVRDWFDKENKKRYATEVVVSNVYFCGSKNQTFTELEGEADDLPF